MKTARNIYSNVTTVVITGLILTLIQSAGFTQPFELKPAFSPVVINQTGVDTGDSLFTPVELSETDLTANIDTKSPSASSRRNSPVAVSHASWFDSTRNRKIPVKIYWPIQIQEKCPVIVFSHGLGGSNEKCAYLGLAWASQGFVSVHVQHPGIDDQVWKLKIRPVKELKDVYYQHRSGRTQANDIRFIINQLDWLAVNGTSLGQKLDMTRVGVAGYDFGGLAAMLVAGQLPPDRGSELHDPRVKAIIVMSPPVADQTTCPPASYGAMSTPALFFTGTEDDGMVGTTKAWQRRIPFDYMQGQDRFLITYQDAGHSIYGGHIRPMKSLDDQKYQANVSQASTLFWRAYLREEPAVNAWFHGRSLGTIVGMLGRIERRLGGYTDSVPSGMTVQSETHEQAFAPVPPSLDTLMR
jgi:predicted dienelactone hydrolase